MTESLTSTGDASETRGSLRSASLRLNEVDSLRDQWLDLIRVSKVDLSMAPQWFASTALASKAESRARIFALFDADDRLVAAVPYITRAEKVFGIRARVRELPGSSLVAYHPSIVTSIAAETVLEWLIADCAGNTDVLVLPNVEKGALTASAARSVARNFGLGSLTRAGHASPYLSIDSDWETFVRSKPKKFRYRIRTGPKDLEAVGAVANRWFNEPADTADLYAAILQIEENSWKAVAGMAISGRDVEREYYELLLPFLVAQRALHANVLYLDSTPIAYSLCYLSHGAVRQLKTSFDQRYADLSPGSVTHRFAIEAAFRSGASEFDFLGDEMLHKNQWASGIREHESVYVFLRGWRGIVLGNIRRLASCARSMQASLRPRRS